MNWVQDSICSYPNGFEHTTERVVISQVRGRLIYENSTYTKEFDFGTEIRDVGVSLKINVDMSVNEKQTLKPSKSVRRFQIVGWR